MVRGGQRDQFCRFSEERIIGVLKGAEAGTKPAELLRFSMHGSASATKLELDSSIPVNVGSLQDRLQMSLLPPDVQRLEVLEE